MGPALETFLGILLLALLVLGGVGFLLRPLWSRLYRFCRNWILRDQELEREQRAQATERKKAERELDAWVTAQTEVSEPTQDERTQTIQKDRNA